ncbi:MAG: DUF6924 domain-containing protein [Thermomicrobiales bacterium]
MPLILPPTTNTPLIRTDFSDDAAWSALLLAITAPSPSDGFQANIDAIDDRAFADATPQAITDGGSEQDAHAIAFIADRQTFASPERPVLCIDLLDPAHPAFRFIPAAAWSVENNLSLGNLDRSDFTNALDPDGIFRGFPGA